MLHREPALSQPPEPEIAIDHICGADILDKSDIFKKRLNHDPEPPSRLSFTWRPPSTIAASFRFAAQRAVWLNPQSGANASLSGDANCRHRRTREAMSAGVSM